MTLNKQQSQLDFDEAVYNAQREEIELALTLNGPSTVSQIHKATGIENWVIRYHCETLKAQGHLTHNWITGRYSR